MGTLLALCDEYRGVLERDQPGQDLLQVCQRLSQAAREVAAAERDAAVDYLQKLIRETEIQRASNAALVAGTLVEIGANPEIAARAVLERLGEILPVVRKCEEECKSRAEDGEITDELRQEVSGTMPEAASAWFAYRHLPMAAIAMISRSKELRKSLRRTTELRDELEKIDDRHFLVILLHVLDDERIIAVHPAGGKGYELVIGGISDNFQLHTLLADALIGFWKLKGKRPSTDVVRNALGEGPQEIGGFAQGIWDLCTWMALTTDGTLPKLAAGTLSTDTMIWGEGVPADIPAFEGTRTILLGPPSYSRSWQANRTFAGLKANLDVTRTMTGSEVRELLGRFVAAKKSLRPS